MNCANKKHGDTRIESPFYSLNTCWRAMRHRCVNPKELRYHGRGISVCKEWDSYEKFKKWALQNNWDKNLTIDRINNNLGYYPQNCRWVGYDIQSRNTSRNVMIGGFFLTDLARELGVSSQSIKRRIQMGWAIEKIRKEPKRIKTKGLPKNIVFKKIGNYERYVVRLGPAGKIRIGAFKSVKLAKNALNDFVKNMK